MKIISVILFTSATIFLHSCAKKISGPDGTSNPPVAANAVQWITTGDQRSLLEKQPVDLPFGTSGNSFPFIDIDSSSSFQVIDGFGYTLTGGSATLINRLESSVKNDLLNELFGKNDNSIGINYLRLSIGASDLNETVFSYDDMPGGQTDIHLNNFTLGKDLTDLVPLLKQILNINPKIKILATPWSPPVWMKDNGSSVGGSLQPGYYGVYARYFVKYIQEMKANGIDVDAITPQNEPMHGGNNPSMIMTADQQASFIKNNLGPAFESAGIKTKIIIWDHNCDNPGYPITVLNDAGAKKYINGSAFHLYNGEITALSAVHNAHPDKDLYFTEQWTGSNDAFDGDLKWHVKNVIIGSMRNWSKVALEWNLANDPGYGPHTPGGCTECKGALTIGSAVSRNVGYYIIAHASKFIPSGSVRIGSNIHGDLFNAAFKTPSGKIVLIAENDGTGSAAFNVRFNGKWFTATLPAGAVATYVW